MDVKGKTENKIMMTIFRKGRVELGLAEHNNGLQLVLRKWVVNEESPPVRSLEATSCAPFASTQPRPSLECDLVPLTQPNDIRNFGADIATNDSIDT